MHKFTKWCVDNSGKIFIAHIVGYVIAVTLLAISIVQIWSHVFELLGGL